MFLFFPYHQSSKNFNKVIPSDKSVWPDAWNTREYKSYEGSFEVSLLRPEQNALTSDIFLERNSNNIYSPDKNVSFEQLSTILYFSASEIEQKKRLSRPYPSAGGLYPLELYVHLKRKNDWAESGIYHYNPRTHSLFLIGKRPANIDMADPNLLEDITVYVTGVFDRTIQKYGDRGYRFMLQESGHLAQNIYLLASPLGVGVCADGSENDSLIEYDLLEIDGIAESLLYKIHVGIPKD